MPVHVHTGLMVLCHCQKTWHADTAKGEASLPIEFMALRVWPVGLINSVQLTA
jgi:hypothetical protein